MEKPRLACGAFLLTVSCLVFIERHTRQELAPSLLILLTQIIASFKLVILVYLIFLNYWIGNGRISNDMHVAIFATIQARQIFLPWQSIASGDHGFASDDGR